MGSVDSFLCLFPQRHVYLSTRTWPLRWCLALIYNGYVIRDYVAVYQCLHRNINAFTHQVSHFTL